MNPETDPGPLPLDPETDKPVPHTGGSTHFGCFACELIGSPYGARYEQPPNPAPTVARAREVFVVESGGIPVKVGLAEDRDNFAQSIAAGVRLGRAEGEERIVRYVPETQPAKKSASKYVPGRPKHRWKEAPWKVTTLDGEELADNLPEKSDFLHGKICKRCGQIKRIIRFAALEKCQNQYRYKKGVWFFGNKVCSK